MSKVYRVRVHHVTEVLVNIPDDLLTPENIAEFEAGFWKLEGDAGAAFAEMVAINAADRPGNFVEGVGKVVEVTPRGEVDLDLTAYYVLDDEWDIDPIFEGRRYE